MRYLNKTLITNLSGILVIVITNGSCKTDGG